MKNITLNNGLKMPAFGLGTWNSTDRSAYHAVKEAIRIGYRHIDCAMIYQNEKEVGEALAECIAEKMVTRDELWVTSKLWNCFHKPEDVQVALQSTLKDLQLDYLDLYLVHWPIAGKPGVIFASDVDGYLPLSEVPNEKTWSAMEEVQAHGLSKTIGVSNFSISKLESLLEKCKIVPAVNQIEVHPFLQQQELITYCAAKGIHITAYSPLGSAGRPKEMLAPNEPSLVGHETIIRVSKEVGLSPGQLLIAWALNRGTSVIPKSTNAERILENFEGSKAELTDEVIKEIDGISHKFRYVDPAVFFYEGVTYSGNSFWD